MWADVRVLKKSVDKKSKHVKWRFGEMTEE